MENGECLKNRKEALINFEKILLRKEALVILGKSLKKKGEKWGGRGEGGSHMAAEGGQKK